MDLAAEQDRSILPDIRRGSEDAYRRPPGAIDGGRRRRINFVRCRLTARPRPNVRRLVRISCYAVQPEATGIPLHRPPHPSHWVRPAKFDSV